MNTNAIVTGSQKYGTPKPDSDVDLVVLVSGEDMHILQQFADAEQHKETKGNYDGVGGLSASLRFGRLNLLLTTDPLAYEVWRRGTQKLVIESHLDGPIDRDTAVRLFNGLQSHCGLNHAEPDVCRRV